MPSQPETVNDTVLYQLRNFYGDQNITVRMLDGSILDIWGPVYVNGSILVDAVGLPIATNAEALAGTDNTKVMTPLRVREAGDARYMLLGTGGGITQAAADLRYLQLTGGALTGTLNINPTLYVGDGTTAGNKSIILYTPLGSNNQIVFNRAGIAKWYIYDANSDNLHIRDGVNSVNFLSFFSGTASTGAVEIGTKLRYGAGVTDVPYGPTWDGSKEVPTRDAIYDKIETIVAGGGGGGTAAATTYAGSTNLVATNVEAALDELDAEKLALTGGALSGGLTITAGSLVVVAGNVYTPRINLRGGGSAATPAVQATFGYGGGDNYPWQIWTGHDSSGIPANQKLTFRAHNTGDAAGVASNEVIQLTGAAVTSYKPVIVPDDAYAASWNGSTQVPTKNAIYDKIETLGTGSVTDVLHVGTSAPVDSAIELWYDTDEVATDTFTQAESDARYVNHTQLKSSGLTGSPDSTGPTSGTIELTIETSIIPATGSAGRIHVWGMSVINRSVTTDRFTIVLREGANEFARFTLDSSTSSTLAPTSSFATDGSADHTLTMVLFRTTGTGTATVGTGSQHALHWIFIPS